MPFSTALLLLHIGSALAAFLVTLWLRYSLGNPGNVTGAFLHRSAWMLWSSFALLVGTGAALWVLRPVPFDVAFSAKLILVAAMAVAGGIFHVRLRRRLANHAPDLQDSAQRVPEDLR